MNKRFNLDTQNLFLTYPQNDTSKEDALDRLKEHFKENLNCAIVAQEQHQDGHNHLHIYLKLNKRFKTTKNTYFNFIALKQGNYQSCRRPTEVIQYVIKTENYITFNIDPTIYLTQKKNKTAITSKGTFKKLCDEINEKTDYVDILKKYPDLCLQHGKKIKEYINDIKTANKPKYRNWEMEVEYLYGDTGTGKSKYAFENYNPETHYVLRKGNGGSVWWDNYTGQETVIIDDFSPKSYQLSYMLNVLDRYAMTIDYKGGATQLLAKKIIITSNYHPDDLYRGESCKEHRKALIRRFTKITEFKRPENEVEVETESDTESETHTEYDTDNDFETYNQSSPIAQYKEYEVIKKTVIDPTRYIYNKRVGKWWDRHLAEWIILDIDTQNKLKEIVDTLPEDHNDDINIENT